MKSLFDYGAVGDGIADDTQALQAAFDAERCLYIPEGVFKVTSTIVQTKMMHISGCGSKSKINAVGAMAQAILFQPDTNENWGNSYHHFSIVGACPSIKIDLSQTGDFLAKLDIDAMWMNNTAGGYSFELANPSNLDGLFTSRISGSVFNGGLKLQRLGDSVTIDNNTITGAGDGINMNAALGASHVIIRENNITSQGYAISVGEAARSVVIEHNQIEHTSGAIPYCIMVSGTNANKAMYTTIRGNNINGHNIVSASLIAMVNSIGGLIDENLLSGCGNGVYLTNTTTQVRIGKRNINSCAAFLTNQSTSNIIE